MPPRPPSHSHVRHLLLRRFSTTPPPPPPSLSSLPHFTPFLKPYSAHKPSFLNALKPFSSQPHSYQQYTDQIALSLSFELLKQPPSLPSQPKTDQPSTTTTAIATSSTQLSLTQRLDLSFSHITLTPQLILQTLNTSPTAGRTALEFFRWVSSQSQSQSNPHFRLTDEILSYFVDYFGRRKDFKIIHELLLNVQNQNGTNLIAFRTFASSVDRLIRAGRPTQAVSMFDKMQMEYGVVRDREKYNYVVTKLCEHGYANYAEKMVKSLANEYFPDEFVCDMLIKGWCVDGKLEEAKRLAREMYRGGFEIGTSAFNAILDCVCKLCRMKDPFRIESEIESVLVDMDMAGVPRNTETFNVILSNLCKIRKTEEAVRLFDRMGEWGCHPDATTYLVLTRSLYQAARVGEGGEMIDRMKSAGFGDALDKKEYYGFLKILCGIERVNHALSVFAKMKRDGCTPGVKTYELLIGKLYAHGRGVKANNLFNEAVRNGVPIERKDYKVDPRFVEKPKVVKKKGKKRLTLPEKMALKRTKLRKLRLSYVKKPKKTMRQAY